MLEVRRKIFKVDLVFALSDASPTINLRSPPLSQ